MDRLTFVIRKNGTKQKAHVWTGEDTACRMWSTGGMKHTRYDFRDGPSGRKICWMCAHVTGLNNEVSKQAIDFGNPVRNIVGNQIYSKKPPDKRIINELIDAMASFGGTCWNPVAEVVGGKAVAWNLMLNQCPGACGHVWKLTMKDDQVSRWLVNEINHRRMRARSCGT